jgi:hypothetical protein
LQSQLPGDSRINGGSHEEVIGFGLETDRRAKAVVLCLHDRIEGISKVSRRNPIHRVFTNVAGITHCDIGSDRHKVKD